MGQVLTAPITERLVDADGVSSSANHQKPLRYGLAAMQGWRRFMEDAHAVKLKFTARNMQYFAVFDGHSGGEVSKYCSHHLGNYIETELNQLIDTGKLDRQNILDTLARAFMVMDEMM